jgi:hypothetical protein
MVLRACCILVVHSEFLNRLFGLLDSIRFDSVRFDSVLCVSVIVFGCCRYDIIFARLVLIVVSVYVYVYLYLCVYTG